MKTNEISFLKLGIDLSFEVNAPIFVEQISIASLIGSNNSDETYLKKMGRIGEALGGRKLASLIQGMQFLAQKMLGNLNLDEDEVLVKEGEYYFVFAKRRNGLINIWSVEQATDRLPRTSGFFAKTCLVQADKESGLPDMVIDHPGNIAKEFFPTGGDFFGKKFVLDEDGNIFEEEKGFWIRDPKIETSVRRFLTDAMFGNGVMSQAFFGGKMFSLLEDGSLFDGQNICPKNSLQKPEYEKLVFLAELHFQGWSSVNTGDTFDASEKFSVHKDVSPCLYF